MQGLCNNHVAYIPHYIFWMPETIFMTPDKYDSNKYMIYNISYQTVAV
jgi:hypothetical protein